MPYPSYASDPIYRYNKCTHLFSLEEMNILFSCLNIISVNNHLSACGGVASIKNQIMKHAQNILMHARTKISLHSSVF